jgi:hypothetical protein
MANPVSEGTLGSRPFVNKYVDVLHEDLNIKINSNFEYAQFFVRYHINSSTSGVKIPFLFYASEFLDSFVVKIDGVRIPVKDIPYDLPKPDGTKFNDFAYIFGDTDYTGNKLTTIETSDADGFNIELRNMIYFETDITEGKHTIEVSYRATQWEDRWDWVKEYSFRYALSPAKYWKSFGTLDITLDSRDFKSNLKSNIGPPKKGSINSIASWHFEKLPTEILQISYLPSISPTASFLLKTGPDILAMFWGLILLIIHLWITLIFRKRYPLIKYSPVVILGSILIPLLFVICWINNYNLIDFFIGEHASRRHGYTFFIAFLYPIILPFYWISFWLIDKRIKRKYN